MAIVVDRAFGSRLAALAADRYVWIVESAAQLATQKAGRVAYESFERALEQRSGALERAVHKVTLTTLRVDAPLIEIARESPLGESK